jgi:chromosome segregation ATPase
MASKAQIQTILKEKYGINKDISQALKKEECEQLLNILDDEPTTVKLIESFVKKNSSLGKNNQYYGTLRYQAEKKFLSLQSEYLELEESIKTLEESKITLDNRKKQLEEDRKKIEAEIQNFSSENENLKAKVQILNSDNKQLIGVNDQLKKENKALKNIVDEIKLKLAIEIKGMLRLEDSEIRKGLVKLFKSTLG